MLQDKPFLSSMLTVLTCPGTPNRLESPPPKRSRAFPLYQAFRDAETKCYRANAFEGRCLDADASPCLPAPLLPGAMIILCSKQAITLPNKNYNKTTSSSHAYKCRGQGRKPLLGTLLGPRSSQAVQYASPVCSSINRPHSRVRSMVELGFFFLFFLTPSLSVSDDGIPTTFVTLPLAGLCF